MDYIAFDSVPYFAQCACVIDEAGYCLAELHIENRGKDSKVVAVIASKDSEKDIGVADCAVAHRLLAKKLPDILEKKEDDIYIELCSPGTERNLKNAAEFGVFKGREVRVWDRNKADWIYGIVKDADDKQVVLKNENGEIAVAFDDIAKAKFIHS